MTDADAQAVARSVARAIRGRSTGEAGRLSTWTDAAYRWGCTVQRFRPEPGAGEGYYDAAIYHAAIPAFWGCVAAGIAEGFVRGGLGRQRGVADLSRFLGGIVGAAVFLAMLIIRVTSR